MSSLSQSTLKKGGKCIVFDFDGVLADSFDCLYSLNKRALFLVGINLPVDKYQDFFNSNFHSALKSYIKEPASYEKVLKFRKRNFEVYYSKADLFPEVPPLIKNLATKNYLAIASSTKSVFINPLLRRHYLKRYFKRVIGTLDYSKEAVLKEIISAIKVKPNQTIMVTDTTGDIRVAKRMGLGTIAVTWGYQPLNLLKKAKPDMIAKTFEELEATLNGDNQV